MPKGQKIETGKLYWIVYKHFPAECQVLELSGSGSIEPKWKNQIRWGLRDAQAKGSLSTSELLNRANGHALDSQNSPLPKKTND